MIGSVSILKLTLASALLISACGQAQGGLPGAAPVKLTVCHSAVSSTQSALIYGLKKGHFARNGLDIALLPVNGGSTAVATLLSGQAQLCQLSPIPAVAAARAGEDVTIVAGIVNVIPYKFMVRPGLRRPEDLIGKTIAVRDLRGTSDLALRVTLKSMGVEPATVKTVSLPSAQAALAAMTTGSVDGTVLQPPENLIAAQMGFLELPIAITTEYQHTAITTRKAFVKENRPAVLAFVRGMSDAVLAMQADEQGAIDVLADFLKLDRTQDLPALKVTFDETIRGRLNGLPRPSRAGVQFLIDQLPANAGERVLTVEDVADFSIVDELERTGALRVKK